MGVYRVIQDSLLVACMGISFVATFGLHLLVEHYSLWREGPALMVRYVIGVSCFLLPFLFWVSCNGDMAASLAREALVLLVGSAGAGTLISYLIDIAFLAKARGGDLTDMGVPDGAS